MVVGGSSSLHLFNGKPPHFSGCSECHIIFSHVIGTSEITNLAFGCGNTCVPDERTYPAANEKPCRVFSFKWYFEDLLLTIGQELESTPRSMDIYGSFGEPKPLQELQASLTIHDRPKSRICVSMRIRWARRRQLRGSKSFQGKW